MNIQAIITCADFAHLLRHTLPRNRHHFSSILIVTRPGDTDTIAVATQNQADTLQTSAFFNNGSTFAKYPALNHAIQYLNHDGWIALLDADVVWPQHLSTQLNPGYLYGMTRRILHPFNGSIPPEHQWHSLPLQKNSTREICGFTQIFHTKDPLLKPPPYFDNQLPNAGAGDSIFARQWPREHQVRIATALHIGLNGQHWNGIKPHT